jgi:hypothetical protein
MLFRRGSQVAARQTTEPTERQRQLLQAANVTLPPRFEQIALRSTE